MSVCSRCLLKYVLKMSDFFSFVYSKQLMSEVVPLGEELMPHREIAVASSSGPSASADFTQDPQTTPIRKLSRNRGLVVQEETVVEDTPDTKGPGTRRRCKRSLT